MKTPFDPVLRVKRRAMDELRIGLRAENENFSAVAAARAGVELRLSREAAISVADVSVLSHAFANRLRAQRRSLVLEQDRVGLRLETMRDHVLEASGQLRAIEGAANDYGDNALRYLNRVEQAEADDLAGSRLGRVATPRYRAGSVDAR